MSILKFMSILKSIDITLRTKVHLVRAKVFPVVMCGCESCTIKKAECRRIGAFELWCWRRLLRVPWTARRSNEFILKKISPKKEKKRKENYSWLSIGWTDAEAPILWPPDVKNWLIREDPDAGKDWREEQKCMTEDEMVGWYHRVNGHEFEQAPGVGDEQESLECCIPWCHK